MTSITLQLQQLYSESCKILYYIHVL